MADQDLTTVMVPYLDPHLAIPILNHLEELDLFDAKDIYEAQYVIASKTSMIDLVGERYEQAFGKAAPAELDQQRQAAIEKSEALSKEVDAVLNVIEDPNVASALKQDKAANLVWLKENYNLTIDQIGVLYRYGWFQFSTGQYSEASVYLYHFRVLSTDPVLTLSSHWGKLAADILTGQFDRALEELKLLRDLLDSSSSRPSAEDGGQEGLVQKRTWLLHWSLFIFFNHEAGRTSLVEMFLSPLYLNTIQTAAPHLLRYLIAALLITRRTTRFYVVGQPPSTSNPMASTSKLSPQVAVREVSRIVASDASRLRPDPIVIFLQKLYTEFDFEAAQDQLRQAQVVATNDFFLQGHVDAFVEAARYLVSETYCRIHQRVDIANLSERLNMSSEEGEKWIVNLIRDTRADAKIDFKENMVHMNQAHPVVYQAVIEKTRGFTFRTAAMGQAMDRRAHPPSAQGADRGGKSSRGRGGGAGGGRGGKRNQPYGQHQQQDGGADGAAAAADAVDTA